MAAKIPLVLNSGLVGQLQSGDYINAPIAGIQEVAQTNDEVGAIVIGAPVYNDAANGVKKAKADAIGTAKPIGLVGQTSIAGAASGIIGVDGVLTATTGQWDAVAGTTGGLTFGTVYYLSAATAGLLTSTAPTTVGQFIVEVGQAISTVDMKILIKAPIGL